MGGGTHKKSGCTGGAGHLTPSQMGGSKKKKRKTKAKKVKKNKRKTMKKKSFFARLFKF